MNDLETHLDYAQVESFLIVQSNERFEIVLTQIIGVNAFSVRVGHL